jgi:hypothetical protein
MAFSSYNTLVVPSSQFSDFFEAAVSEDWVAFRVSEKKEGAR